MLRNVSKWPSGLLRRAERFTPLDLPLHHRVRLWRNGFRSWSSYMYELDKNDMKDYLPDSAMHAMQSLNGEIGKSIFRNKLLFAAFFREHFDHPPVLGWLERGRTFTAEGRAAPADGVRAWLEAHPDGLILKPFSGSEGRGVFHLASEGARLRINGEVAAEDAYEALVAKLSDYLVTPFVRQASYAEQVFAKSSNTLRVVTMQSHAVEPFVAVAVHRFGTSGSVPVDNASRGGLVGPIDPETGRVGVAARLPTKSGERLARYTHHPDTGAAIEGLVVPRWREVRDHLLGVVAELPFLRYVGWDVIVTEKGHTVIEGNSGASLLAQMFHPYLKDERIRAFLRSVEIDC